MSNFVGPGLWVTSFIYKYETSTTYPLRDILYLKINDVCEYNLPYPQSAFVQPPISLKRKQYCHSVFSTMLLHQRLGIFIP